MLYCFEKGLYKFYYGNLFGSSKRHTNLGTLGTRNTLWRPFQRHLTRKGKNSADSNGFPGASTIYEIGTVRSGKAWQCRSSAALLLPFAEPLYASLLLN